MTGAYKIEEARYLQQRSAVSAADAVSVISAYVPDNMVWSILQAAYYPSAAETRSVYFQVYTLAGNLFPVTNPESIALSSGLILPLLREGMELLMFPGDRLQVTRDVATAGSTMTLKYRLIETDLPIYQYIEPQIERRMRRSARELISTHFFGGRGRGGGSAGGVLGFPSGGGPTGMEK